MTLFVYRFFATLVDEKHLRIERSCLDDAVNGWAAGSIESLLIFSICKLNIDVIFKIIN